MISENLKLSIAEDLGKKYSTFFTIENITPVGGGDINEAYLLVTNKGKFFVKLNIASRYPLMFEKEAKGLELLKNAEEINVPEVICYGDTKNQSWLLLNYIESSKQIPGYWEDFGKSLARLHKNTADYFGLDHDNYIGSLPQSNKQQTSWTTFFIEERLNRQLKMARNQGEISRETIYAFERLYKRLDEIFPEEPPALLHGDLWSGNYMTGNDGKACLIDPAVYYGHREMDLGMSKLFGGFSQQLYLSYHEEFPLEKGWENRVDICNLYPLMVHVNLFGGGYVNSVKNILKRF